MLEGGRHADRRTVHGLLDLGRGELRPRRGAAGQDGASGDRHDGGDDPHRDEVTASPALGGDTAAGGGVIGPGVGIVRRGADGF